ncbi:MAG: hypothetical protein KHW87_01505 [Clostridiales bacterium]|nr:hypothetical protein [Clostridiales bacterium]
MMDHQNLSAPKQTPLDADAVMQTSGRGKTTASDLFTDEEIAVEETIYDTADSLPLSSKPILTGSSQSDTATDDRVAANSDVASDVSISKDEYDAVLQSLLRAEHWIDAQLESLSTPGTNENTNSDGFRTVDSAAFDDSNTLPEQTAKNNKDINIDTESIEANQTTLKSEMAGITTPTAKENNGAIGLGRRDEGASDISLADESGQAVHTAQTSDGSSQNESTSEHASTLQQREARMPNSTVPPLDFAARYSESVPGQVSSSSAFSQTAQTKRPSLSSEVQDQTASMGDSTPLHKVWKKSDTAEFSALTSSHADAVLVANTDSHLDTVEKIESNQPDTTDMQINSRTDRGTESGDDVGTDTKSGAAKQTQANRKKAVGTRTPDTPTHVQNDPKQNAEPDEKVEVLTRKAMRGDTVAFRVWRNGTRTTLVQGTLFDDARVSTNEKQQKTKHCVSAKTQRINKWFASRTAHVLAVSFSAILVLAAIFFGTFGLLLRGPSPALRNQTVRVLREHTISAWVPSVFLSDTELQRILLAQAGEQS